MFNKLRNVLSGPDHDQNSKQSTSREAAKYPYSRPHFLQLNEDEIQASIDHRLRPIISPSKKLANYSGYAECINGGKSRYNEDQAVTHQAVLASGNVKIPYTYFGLFDGHAGVGAAICAANQLHHVLHQRLVDAQDDLWLEFLENEESGSRHDLVIGALEMAFTTMDDIIKEELVRKQSNGGCTALVAICILGHLYVANAGDSRAVVCSGSNYRPLSNDFTPETEKDRIRQLAQLKPHLLGKDYTFIEYIRQPKMKDLGKRILFKDSLMKGWSYKTIGQDDLKPSLITGQGKRSRVMGTIGVTRGFGDHDLVSVYQKIPIKPFLSCHPEVQVFNLNAAKPQDVLIMGTDGLWDVLDGLAAAKIITDAMEIFDGPELYVSAATCLVGAARGTLKEHQWMMKTGKCASVDDISVFVIPLHALAQDHIKMKQSLNLEELREQFGLVDDVPPVDQDGENEKNKRENEYISSIVQEIRNKQKEDQAKTSGFNDLCIISPKGDDLPLKDFLLVNVNSIDSIGVSAKSNLDNKKVDASSVNIRRLENLDGSLELLLLEAPKSTNKKPSRTRSYPTCELKTLLSGNKNETFLKWNCKDELSATAGDQSFLYTIKLKRREEPKPENGTNQRENI